MRFFRLIFSIGFLGWLTVADVVSQTTLNQGDISLIGLNGSDPDGVAFVTWVNISPSTMIKFSDNAFLSAGSANAANNGRGGEGFLVWTANMTVTAGSVVTISNNSGWVCNTGTAASYGSFALSTSGDNLFAYQGIGIGNSVSTCDWGTNSNPTTFTGTILFGIVYASNWLSSGSPTTNTTYRPSELSLANLSVALTTGGTRNGQYTAARNNQQNLIDYQPIVANIANWTTYANNTTLDSTTFTTAPPPPSPEITVTGTLPDMIAYQNCNSTVVSYSVSGAGLTDDISITSPTEFKISLNAGGPFSNNIVLPQSGGNVPTTTIYVYFEATCVCSINGNITHTSTGATQQNQATTGVGTQPTVMINKYSIAADDVELLIKQNAANLAGVIIKDFSSSMNNDNGGSYTFNNVAPWTSLPQGTLVILRGGSTAAPDTDPSDFLVEIGLENTTYFTKNAGTFNLATTEMVMLKAAGSGTTGVNGNIHTLSAGIPSALYNSITGPKINNPTTPGSSSFVAVSSANETDCDFATGSVSILATTTFGLGNNSNNQNYICNLRGNLGAPTITGPATLCSGDDLTLSTSVSGASSYYWTGPNGFTDVSSSPTIFGASAINSGTYSVVAIFGAGCSTAVAQHSVVIAPCSCPSAANLTTTNIEFNNVTLNWTVPLDTFSYPVDSVRLFLRRTGLNVWYRIHTFTVQTSYRQYQLQAGANYQWKIVTYCSSGDSTETALQPFSTASYCGLFSNLSSTPNLVSPATSVDVSWSYLPGPATNFEVLYKVSGTQTKYQVLTTSNSFATITGLTQNTTYEWRIRALCGGLSHNSVSSTFTTDLACPVPNNLLTTNILSDRATFSWSSDSASYYQVSYREVGSNTWKNHNNITNQTVIQGGLLANTMYEWRVRGYCSAGYGSWSMIDTFLTNVAKTQSATQIAEVYPNPTTGVLQIAFNQTKSQVVAIQVLDVTGRILVEQTAFVETGYQQITLDIINLPSGIYQLRLSSGGGVSSAKIIKH